MVTLEFILSFVILLISGALGFMARWMAKNAKRHDECDDKTQQLELKVRDLHHRIVSEDKIRQIVEDKITPLRVDQHAADDRLRKIEEKLDKLIEKLM